MEEAAAYIVGSIIVALGLYWVRCRWISLYGVLEILVGIGAIAVVVLPPSVYATYTAMMINYNQTELKSAAIVAGIYVIVRGLDNIAAGLSPQWRTRWNRLFRLAREGDKGVTAL